MARRTKQTLSDTVANASNFHFGWCNACERYACGESADAIVATPTKDSAATSERGALAVTAGVHAALGILTGDGGVEQSRATAAQYKLRADRIDQLVQLALDA